MFHPKRKKILAIFLFYSVKKFEKKNYLSDPKNRVKTIFLDIRLFVEKNEVLRPKRKKIMVFFIFFM